MAHFLGTTKLGEIEKIVDQTGVYFCLGKIDGGKDVCLFCDIKIDKNADIHVKLALRKAAQPLNSMLAVENSSYFSVEDHLLAFFGVREIR